MATRRWRTFWIGWALLSLLSTAWAFATPISGSPDEPAHIVKAAAVVRGELTGTVGAHGNMYVKVPAYIDYSQAAPCFAFHAKKPASCMAQEPKDGGSDVTSRTLAGLYNPVYYALVGWPSLLFDNVAGIYAMRIVSGVLSSLFLAFSLLMICSWRRPAMPLLSASLATPPMLLFLAGAVNPNAFETATILTVFIATFSILRYPDDFLLAERLTLLAIAAALGVNARGLSPLWLAVAVLTPFIIAKRSTLLAVFRRGISWIAVAVSAAGAAFAVAWLLMTNSLAAASQGGALENLYPGAGSSPLAGFILTLENTFGSAQDMIGDFGWLDTMAPLGVFYAWAGMVGMLLFTALAVGRRRELLLLGAEVGCFVLLPALIQGAYIYSGGIIWQGRYALPLFAILIVGAATIVGENMRTSPVIVNRLTPMVLLIWAACQWLCFGTVLRRYAVGSEGTIAQLLRAPDWVAPGGNITWLVVFAMLLGVLIVAWWYTIRRASDAERAPATAEPARQVVPA
jgi:hypothetical protein